MKKLIAAIASSGLLIAGFFFAPNNAVMDSAIEVEPDILSDGPAKIAIEVEPDILSDGPVNIAIEVEPGILSDGAVDSAIEVEPDIL